MQERDGEGGEQALHGDWELVNDRAGEEVGQGRRGVGDFDCGVGPVGGCCGEAGDDGDGVFAFVFAGEGEDFVLRGAMGFKGNVVAGCQEGGVLAAEVQKFGGDEEFE